MMIKISPNYYVDFVSLADAETIMSIDEPCFVLYTGEYETWHEAWENADLNFSYILASEVDAVLAALARFQDWRASTEALLARDLMEVE
jgi:hypothetical protein